MSNMLPALTRLLMVAEQLDTVTVDEHLAQDMAAVLVGVADELERRDERVRAMLDEAIAIAPVTASGLRMIRDAMGDPQ